LTGHYHEKIADAGIESGRRGGKGYLGARRVTKTANGREIKRKRKTRGSESSEEKVYSVLESWNRGSSRGKGKKDILREKRSWGPALTLEPPSKRGVLLSNVH